MDEHKMNKKILYIKNFSYDKCLNYLDNLNSVNSISSIELIDYNFEKIKKLVEMYEIIILGGGNQHLTLDNFLITYPEIKNQIEIVKLVSIQKNKLLIGICLGCQIIAYSFGFKIIKAPELIFGFDLLDTNTINFDHIVKNNDQCLNKLDFDLISKSFSFHYDYIDFTSKTIQIEQINQDELILIAYSLNKHPYIIANKNSNIYGFQFHPEITFDSIINIIDLFNLSNEFDVNSTSCNSKQFIFKKIFNHFFYVFTNK